MRLQVHLLGYVPYALVWVLVFRGYDNAKAVWAVVAAVSHQMVIGTFVVFTVFGLVQLVLRALPLAPSLYAWGELVYIVLSFAAGQPWNSRYFASACQRRQVRRAALSPVQRKSADVSRLRDACAGTADCHEARYGRL